MSAQLADDELLIRRTFDAPAEVVFALWTEVEHYKAWMGPVGYECRHAEIDLRVGGAYRTMIYSLQDEDENWFGGVYKEIDAPRRLVFTHAWEQGPSKGVETVVTIVLTERDGQTEQVFHQTGFRTADARDRHLGGWARAFDCLDQHLETLKSGAV